MRGRWGGVYCGLRLWEWKTENTSEFYRSMRVESYNIMSLLVSLRQARSTFYFCLEISHSLDSSLQRDFEPSSLSTDAIWAWRRWHRATEISWIKYTHPVTPYYVTKQTECHTKIPSKPTPAYTRSFHSKIKCLNRCRSAFTPVLYSIRYLILQTSYISKRKAWLYFQSLKWQISRSQVSRKRS